jgi:DnaJ family protein A protein 2
MSAPVETELYDVLGVPPSASEGDIKKAYRQKAKEHHPDKNPNDPEAGAKFQELGAAYEILSDPNSRAIYDERGIAGLGSGGGPGGGMDPADLFAQFFGGMPSGFPFEFDVGGGAPRKRQDDVIPYEVTLEDLYNGKCVKMNMEKNATCGTCQGSGGKKGTKAKPCVKCEGKGWTFTQTQISQSRIATSRSKCHECDGIGEKIREKDRCKKCKGEKIVKEKTRQEIFVEKGMSDRQRIVLAGAGDEEPGMPPGDVVFVLKQLPHKTFERSGSDLLTTITITLSEALLGFSRILLTHLDGRGIKVSSPPLKVIQPNQTLVLRGEGMPTYKNPEHKGNLYVALQIEMPDESWLASVDRTALAAQLPPKRQEISPLPAIVDEVEYEESDIHDVRERSFPAGPDFFDNVFGNTQFGDAEEDEDDWEDDEEDGPHDFGFHPGGEPECRTQ